MGPRECPTSEEAEGKDVASVTNTCLDNSWELIEPSEGPVDIRVHALVVIAIFVVAMMTSNIGGGTQLPPV